jgi:hypothetical protein
MELHYAGRGIESMAFVDELTLYGDRVDIYPSGTRRLDVQELLQRLSPGTSVYACGPRRLLSALEDAAPTHVLLRTERFPLTTLTRLMTRRLRLGVQDRESDGPFLPIRASSLPSGTRVSGRYPNARRASAAPARPMFWRASRTIVICS